MIKFAFFTLLILSLNINCNSDKSTVVSLIDYTSYVEPSKTYDSMRKDYTRSGLTDSLKIIGHAIFEPVIKFRIDTLLVNRYGVSLEKLQEKIATFKKLKSIKEIENERIITDSGAEIPITAIISIHYTSGHYKPEIFLPKPERYKYKGRRAVIIEIYFKKKNQKKLIEFIKSNFHKYSDSYTFDFEYEILKQKIDITEK
ncbi:MAG: hypothetical protein GY756_18990 [bacterium]|nr:hypothetical protein [bacterium]